MKDRELRKTQAGAPYLACLLADRTATLGGRWWKATEASIEKIPERGFVKVRGRAETYRGQIQLIIERLEVVDAKDADVDALIPKTRRDTESMWEDVHDLLAEIQNGPLSRLVQAFLDDEELMSLFKKAPAGAQIHHAAMGGLLEHTLMVMRMVRVASLVYADHMNADLLLAAAFLHDIGKVDELTVEGSYTDRGNLVGHIPLGVVRVQQKADEVARGGGVPIPQETIDLVQHLLVSHHGSRERGSPRLPMTPEALLLHAIDDLDARLDMALSAIERDGSAEASFTRYHRTLDVKLYKKSRELPE